MLLNVFKENSCLFVVVVFSFFLVDKGAKEKSDRGPKSNYKASNNVETIQFNYGITNHPKFNFIFIFFIFIFFN